jgi:hypothetical protein
MENDETVETRTTDNTEVETKNGEAETVEETAAETTTESESETTDTTVADEKLTYEQKLARATTPEEKFKIADAEANKNRRLLSKGNKPSKPLVKPNAPRQAQTQPSVEETVLSANGMPDELLAQLKKVAAVSGTTLIKAQNDPIFVAMKEKFEKDTKQKNASLPASRGAGNVKPSKNFHSPGLTRDEHKEMFNRIVNK